MEWKMEYRDCSLVPLSFSEGAATTATATATTATATAAAMTQVYLFAQTALS
jgi:hypothetical protein